MEGKSTASSQVGPTPFQEALRCDACKCTFNTFRRRHHCRCCGRTLCNEHSSNQMALPQFGIFTAVRVCSDCFNSGLRPEIADVPSSNSLDATTNGISRLDLDKSSVKSAIGLYGKAEIVDNTTKEVAECKCGMPLCICAAPTPDPIPVQVQKPSTKVTSKPPQRRNVEARRGQESNVASIAPSTSVKKSLFFNAGQASGGRLEKACTKYEPSGEGLREAIKNDDVSAVNRLLSEGVDANYCDKQGMSLLHLAALFNRTEITFILMDHRARSDRKNAQGETPIDCAPAMLQHKMRTRLQHP